MKLKKNVEITRTRRSDCKEIGREMVTSNWFNVYQSIARSEGRRLHWLGENVYEVIFTEKDYTVTLIRH